MKKLFLSLASVPLFAGFAAANANESTPSEKPATLEPTTLDAATLDGITAAGSNGEHRCKKCDGGDRTYQNNQSILSGNNVSVQAGLLSNQYAYQDAFHGNISD